MKLLIVFLLMTMSLIRTDIVIRVTGNGGLRIFPRILAVLYGWTARFCFCGSSRSSPRAKAFGE